MATATVFGVDLIKKMIETTEDPIERNEWILLCDEVEEMLKTNAKVDGWIEQIKELQGEIEDLEEDIYNLREKSGVEEAMESLSSAIHYLENCTAKSKKQDLLDNLGDVDYFVKEAHAKLTKTD